MFSSLAKINSTCLKSFTMSTKLCLSNYAWIILHGQHFFQFNQIITAHMITIITENTAITLAAAPLSASVTGGLLDDISA